MRFIIWISAVIIAAAINLDYCKDVKIGLYLVGIIALGWDVLELHFGRQFLKNK